MTFLSLLKIVRKGSYFYHFILSANIERRRKQDSYCDYIRISQIYITGRNINKKMQSRTTLPNLKQTKNIIFLA